MAPGLDLSFGREYIKADMLLTDGSTSDFDENDAG
jgi:hypothetical protein